MIQQERAGGNAPRPVTVDDDAGCGGRIVAPGRSDRAGRRLHRHCQVTARTLFAARFGGYGWSGMDSVPSQIERISHALNETTRASPRALSSWMPTLSDRVG